MGRRFLVAASIALFAGLASAFSQAQEAKLIVGKFLEHVPGSVMKMKPANGADYGSWQTSDLAYDRLSDQWWSIGDQNSLEEGIPKGKRSWKGRYLYRLWVGDQPMAEPIPIHWENDAVGRAVHESFAGFGKELIDFEGLAADPNEGNRFFACTEGKEPWLVELEYRHDEGRAVVVHSVRLPLLGDDENESWEGIAVSSRGDEIYLGTESTTSSNRIYKVATKKFRDAKWTGGQPPILGLVALDRVRLVSGACALTIAEHEGKTYLIAVERNVPTLHVIDLAPPHKELTVKLDLRAPSQANSSRGIAIGKTSPETYGGSPEGIGVGSDGIVVLIGDPVKAHYVPKRSAADPDVARKLSDLIPLVFQKPLGELLAR